MHRLAISVERMEWEAEKVKLDPLEGTKETSQMEKAMEHKRDEHNASFPPSYTATVNTPIGYYLRILRRYISTFTICIANPSIEMAGAYQLRRPH